MKILFRSMGFFYALLLFSIQGITAEMKTLDYYQEQAEKFHNVLTVPPFETSAEAIQKSVEELIGQANQAADAFARQATSEVTFDGTLAALDAMYQDIDAHISRIWTLKETSPEQSIREAATAAVQKFEEWYVGFQHRKDVYQVVKAYAETRPELEGEKSKLFDEVLRDYRRLGFELPQDEQEELEEMKKELARMSTEFDTNITNATAPLIFTQEQLEGVPETFLNQKDVNIGDDQYRVMANISWHYLTILENARNEDTRRQVLTARYNLAREKNIPLLQKIVELRTQIARKLGYDSWADYKTEIKMAKSEKSVSEFLQQLKEHLRPKFEAEMEIYRKLKAEETGEENPTVNMWDWRYYRNQYMKKEYDVDMEALKVYFPYAQTLEGMFNIYETIFGISIEQIENPCKWQEDVTLHVVTDAASGEPLGLFYLDMFPREGKYNHFAQFGIISARQLDNGKNQRPTVALICNFPPPTEDQPSLLDYDNVRTLFHEFGHCLHSILSRAAFGRFAGTSVPRDFVEVPSQVLEYWLESKEVLDTFAAHYEDPSRKFPENVLERIIDSEKATVGTVYTTQVAYALVDMSLHNRQFTRNPADVVEKTNQIISDVLMPVPEDTAFVAAFGHLTGYDAGYYGYAWADVISADMATVFESAPRGFLDPDVGLRMRREIFEQGDRRDVNESIHAFLGRKHTIEPFLKKLGIEEN
ncbi:MAG: M3 family metallopeptidase [bacterium]|jgi:thimet oligopeptidase